MEETDDDPAGGARTHKHKQTQIIERVTARITQTINTHQPSDQLVINDEKDITGWRSERVCERIRLILNQFLTPGETGEGSNRWRTDGCTTDR